MKENIKERTNKMEKLKQLNKELQTIQERLERTDFDVSEKLQNIIDEISNLVEARVKPKIADILKELFEKYTEEKRNNYDDAEFYISGLQDGKLVALAEIKERLSNFSV